MAYAEASASFYREIVHQMMMQHVELRGEIQKIASQAALDVSRSPGGFSGISKSALVYSILQGFKMLYPTGQ